MPHLTIKAGRAYMVSQPERVAALHDLRDRLRQGGVNVDLEVTHYVPGRVGLPPPGAPEEIAIFIGKAVASGLVGALTADVYNRTKHWARDRYALKRKAAREAKKDENWVKGERFTIYGPDDQVLKSWTIDKDGEHETDGT